VTVRQLFGLVYVIERAALDELALDESFGATSEAWPGVAQMVRRASFDVWRRSPSGSRASRTSRRFTTP